MAISQRPGWTSREIFETMYGIIEELSLLTEGQHKELMIEITEDMETVIPMSDRIADRYTVAHIIHYSVSVNDSFAEDLQAQSKA